jgi:hypothetical protein
MRVVRSGMTPCLRLDRILYSITQGLGKTMIAQGGWCLT